MPLALALVAIDIVCLLHAAATGRLRPWALVIVALPGIGVLAYVAIELVPDWRTGRRARMAQRGIARALAPERRYRALRQQIAENDSTAVRADLAGACLDLGLYSEAQAHYADILARPHGVAPGFMLGRAQRPDLP